MAYNVISCKKIKRNTQKIKIADFDSAPELKNHQKYQKDFALNRDLLNFLFRYGIF